MIERRLASTKVARLSRCLAVASVLLIAGCDEGPTSPDSADQPSATAGGAAPAGVTLGATRFLAFGDSMTQGEVTGATGASTWSPMNVVPSASFPAQLQDRLRARYRGQSGEIAVDNAGRSGELAVNALPRLAQLLANSPTHALLLFDGSNDLLDFGANGVSPASAAMNQMAREGRLRGARVFIGLLPPGIAGRQRSVDDAAIRDYNDRLRAIAAGEGAVVVDLYRAISTDVGRYIGADGHHPTAAGYQRIADEFQAQIAAALERR